MPERGSGPTGGAIVTSCEGRCAYLGEGGLCGLHAAYGPAAKPVGCSTFPASFTDDGEVVRVSVSVECACVLASVGREGGSPLIPQGAEVLLETRFPYLSAAQRLEVLRTTAVDAGWPLLDGPEQWGRLNLFAAADGYGAFDQDVVVAL